MRNSDITLTFITSREDGWRDFSASRATNVYGALSWRNDVSAVDIAGQYGDSKLRGNGAAPVGLLALDREAVFTAPDITENDMRLVTIEANHDIGADIELAGNGFYRRNSTDSFNGDASEFVTCELAGTTFLLENLEDDALEALGLELDSVCAGGDELARRVPGVRVTDPDSLEEALNVLAGDDAFEIEDLSDELSGTGLLSDAAINNRSEREQETYGTNLQVSATRDLFDRGNYFVFGFAYFKGEADFISTTELSELDPMTRTTAGLGLGHFRRR